MIQFNQTHEKFRKHFLRKEHVVEYLLAGAAILLFTALVYLSVTVLFTN
jgi:hypothetical protein